MHPLLFCMRATYKPPYHIRLALPNLGNTRCVERAKLNFKACVLAFHEPTVQPGLPHFTPLGYVKGHRAYCSLPWSVHPKSYIT